MLHISLFSGIGGFDLASEWMGWQNIVSCEINPFSRKILEYHFPNSYHHDDIHTLTYEKINQELTKRYGSNWRTNDIILTGGFPCQPYSLAGKRKGKDDDRHLWPEMLRAIREIQPTLVVGENVRGLINWNGGMVFDEVQADLEAEGYEVIPFILPACGVNAPHRRDRVWFIAYSDNARRSAGLRQVSGADEEVPERHEDAKLSNAGCGTTTNAISGSERPSRKSGGAVSNRSKNDSQSQEWKGETKLNIGCSSILRNPPNANNEGLQRSKKFRGVASIWQKRNEQPSRLLCTTWDNFPTESPVLPGNDGIPSELDGITFSKWRNESIKAAGNAVVPQVVFQIFKAIQAVNDAHGQPER